MLRLRGALLAASQGEVKTLAIVLTVTPTGRFKTRWTEISRV